MKIEIIVPSNNIKEINEFLASYITLDKFKYQSSIIIIANGELKVNDIQNRFNGLYKFIRCDHNEQLIPFVMLNGLGMIDSTCDYFLQLDDDHRFEKGSDIFLIRCIEFLNHSNCSVLYTDRERDYKNGLSIKEDGFIWSNRGLFIKNVFSNNEIEELYNLHGAGVDLLFAYLALEKEGLPYQYYGSPVTRKEKRYVNGEVLFNPSYTKENMDKNIIGFVRDRYDESKDWVHQSDGFITRYPNKLREIIKERIKYENISNCTIK